MKYLTIFNLISAVVKKADVSCVLIGGFAVNFYKATRHTADVDFLIAKKDLKKVSPLFEKESYRPEVIEKIFARFKDDGEYGMPIDFMFVDRATLDKVVKDGRKVEISGESFIIPALYDLIALKIHSIKYNPDRELKDLLDIVSLIRANSVDIHAGNFKELCFKYGTEELYNKILAYCERK
jgi:predicted nucleotidyltransferase